MFGVVAQKW